MVRLQDGHGLCWHQRIRKIQVSPPRYACTFSTVQEFQKLIQKQILLSEKLASCAHASKGVLEANVPVFKDVTSADCGAPGEAPQSLWP